LDFGRKSVKAETGFSFSEDFNHLVFANILTDENKSHSSSSYLQLLKAFCLVRGTDFVILGTRLSSWLSIRRSTGVRAAMSLSVDIWFLNFSRSDNQDLFQKLLRKQY
jgi:hypothetical protein